MIGSSGSRISSVCLASHSCRTGAWTAGIIGVAAGDCVAVAVCAAALLGATAAVPTNPAPAANTTRREIGASSPVWTRFWLGMALIVTMRSSQNNFYATATVGQYDFAIAEGRKRLIRAAFANALASPSIGPR